MIMRQAPERGALVTSQDGHSQDGQHCSRRTVRRVPLTVAAALAATLALAGCTDPYDPGQRAIGGGLLGAGGGALLGGIAGGGHGAAIGALAGGALGAAGGAVTTPNRPPPPPPRYYSQPGYNGY